MSTSSDEQQQNMGAFLLVLALILFAVLSVYCLFS